MSWSSDNLRQRVVITGLGVVSPVGIGKDAFWDAVVQGRSGIDWIEGFDTSDLYCRIAGQVRDFDPAQYMDAKEAKRAGRFSHFAVAAARLAVADADLDLNDGFDPYQAGAIFGTSLAGNGNVADEMYKQFAATGPRHIEVTSGTQLAAHAATSHVLIQLGLKGPNSTLGTGCVAGLEAINNAASILRSGQAQVMIAGGTEAQIIPLTVAAFNAARALSTRNHEPQKASRPFDAERDGFIIAEGAAVLIMESLPFAMKRGAPILAEVLGYGATADAYHITQPLEGGEGGVRAMRIALKKAGLEPGEIDYINAHGTSTPMNDLSETNAIKEVFGNRAHALAVSSTKSQIGHLIAAAGAVEGIFCALAIKHSTAPMTANLRTPDPECDLDYVSEGCRPMQIDVAMSNSFGFGGSNSCLVFRSPLRAETR